MLGAVIRYGNNTLVVELPTGTMDLQSKLSSIGIQNLPEDILLADEDSNPIRVKLYAAALRRRTSSRFSHRNDLLRTQTAA